MDVGHVCAAYFRNTCGILMMDISNQSCMLVPWTLTWPQNLSCHFYLNGISIQKKACLLSPARSQSVNKEMGNKGTYSLAYPDRSVCFIVSECLFLIYILCLGMFPFQNGQWVS